MCERHDVSTGAAQEPISRVDMRMARPQIIGPHRLEEMQDVLRTRGCPQGK